MYRIQASHMPCCITVHHPYNLFDIACIDAAYSNWSIAFFNAPLSFSLCQIITIQRSRVLNLYDLGSQGKCWVVNNACVLFEPGEWGLTATNAWPTEWTICLMQRLPSLHIGMWFVALITSMMVLFCVLVVVCHRSKPTYCGSTISYIHTVTPLISVEPNLHTSMFLVSSYNRLCQIHWDQVLSRVWRCSCSSADRRCSN